MAVEFFRNCLRIAINEQIYYFEEKKVEDCMQKNVSRFYYTDIFFSRSLFYYKYFIIILLSFCKKVFPSVSRDQLCRNWADKNNINAQRKDPHTVKEPLLLSFSQAIRFSLKWPCSEEISKSWCPRIDTLRSP